MTEIGLKWCMKMNILMIESPQSFASEILVEPKIRDLGRPKNLCVIDNSKYREMNGIQWIYTRIRIFILICSIERISFFKISSWFFNDKKMLITTRICYFYFQFVIYIWWYWDLSFCIYLTQNAYYTKDAFQLNN